MSGSRAFLDGRVIALAAILAVAGTACQAAVAAPGGGGDAAPAPGTVQAVKRTPPNSHVPGLIANARAAQRQGDSRALRGFQSALTALVGQAAVSAARTDHARVLADLAAADAIGDSHARADFLAQLLAMCEPGGLVSAFESCETADVASAR